jgi:hypothetical protein
LAEQIIWLQPHLRNTLAERQPANGRTQFGSLFKERKHHLPKPLFSSTTTDHKGGLLMGPTTAGNTTVMNFCGALAAIKSEGFV